MKLIGDLKTKVVKSKTRQEAKEIIEQAGMELDDDEMDEVAGGIDIIFAVGEYDQLIPGQTAQK